MSNFTIDKYRFTKIIAERYPEAEGKRGYLNQNLQLAINRGSQPNIILPTVQITILGLPGEKPQTPPKNIQPSFKIEVQAEGYTIWEEPPTDDYLKTKAALTELCRTVHVVAALEVRKLATQLGLSPIKINMDLLKSMEESKMTRTSSAPAPRKRSSKKVPD